MKILYVPGDFSGPGFYRLVFPMLALRDLGHEVTTPPYRTLPSGDKMLEFRGLDVSGFDVVAFHNVAERVYLGLAREARRLGVATVADRDDSDLHPSWHPAFESSKSNPDRNQFLRASLFQAVDCVTVSTAALAEEWRSRARRVEVLPNCLFWPMWEGVTPQYDVERVRPRIGWMGVSKWRLGDLDVLKPVARAFLDEHPAWDFVAAGDPDVHAILGIPEGRGLSFDRVSFPRGLAEITASMDIGLVPLARRDPVEEHFNDCKSNLKGMEYAACGIPAVASPSQPYVEWLGDGKAGRLAARPEEWLGALRELAADPGLRAELGREARRRAEARHVGLFAHLWEGLYCDLAERAKRRAGGASLSLRAGRPSSKRSRKRGRGFSSVTT